MRLPIAAIKGIIPLTAPPAPEAPGPFSFGDRERVARILTAAGFTDIAISPFQCLRAVRQWGDAGRGTRRSGEDGDRGWPSVALADQPDYIRDRASAAARSAFADFPGERSVMIDGATWIVTARNPTS